VDALRDTLVDGRRDSVHETLVDGFVDSSWTEESLSGKSTPGTQGRRGTGPVAGKHAFSKRVPQLQSFQRQSGEKQHSRCPLNRREAPKPFSQQRARQWRSTGVCGFALARRLVELSQTREQGIESPLNPFSSCDRRAHSISKSCDSASARYAFCTQWNQQVSGRSPRKILKCEFREHIASYSEGERSARKLFNRVEQHARALLHTRIFESSRLLLAGPHVSDGNTQRTKMFAKIVRNEKIN
jgi:hypothetical protein